MTPSLRSYVALVLSIVLLTVSCTLEKRLYRPGFHVEHPWNTGEVRSAMEEVRCSREDGYVQMGKDESAKQSSNETSHPVTASNAEDGLTIPPIFSPVPRPPSSVPRPQYPVPTPQSSVLSPHSPLPSPLSPDTLKKPFQSPKQYREVDPIGRYSVITVLAGVALQKLAGILTWFEVIMPLSFGPGIFIPALVVALVGLCLSAYSAYRVRKFPEKYKKNEWGKAALAILGWQILMSALFAWLLGGLPIG